MQAHLIPVLLCALLGAELPDDFSLTPPPGSFVGPPKAASAMASNYASGTPVVATTYFYWYDVETKAHVVNGDGTDALTDHPPTLEGLSYKNVAWHASQLADMIDAGIDVALPVYWGVPYSRETFSDEGLPKLVAARQRLLREGKRAPAIGLFYDTSTLRFNGKGYRVDLTTDAGRRWFYGTIRNFFSYIPWQHRACIDGKPLVLLYSHTFARAVDDALFPALRQMFRKDFGTDLYLVKMRGWPGPADSEYQWGAALAPQILETAGLGPGYDHSAVPGRSPLVRDREDGRFYRFGWTRLLAMNPASRPWLVHLETWNEFHEGTEICETAEYGRQYIELTRHYADMFHDRKRIDRDAGLSTRKVASAAPGESEGLRLIAKPDGDGPIVEATVAGKPAWSTTKNRHSEVNRYLYFDVDYLFLFDENEPVEVTIEYLDAGPQAFTIHYDSADPAVRGIEQSFHSGPTQEIQGSRKWKTVTFVLPHARFANRGNGCDFRLACTGAELSVAQVSVRRVRGR